MACGTAGDGSKSHSEAALIVAIKGEQDYYTIQWAERGAAQATPLTFDVQHWLGRLRQLMPIFLCARIPGDKAPYPSCSSRLPGDDEPVDTAPARATR